MKAIVLLNGEPYRLRLKKDGYVYCCDGAYDWAKDKIEIDENLGDFDSIIELPLPPPSYIYPAEKNYTDGEIAVRRAIKRGADEIAIYGGFGGRSDHFLGNLHLLRLAHDLGAHAKMIAPKESITYGEGYIDLSGLNGQTLSIVPFGGDAHIIESSGLKYPLMELDLKYGSTRGISNIAVSDKAHIVARGGVLIIVNVDDDMLCRILLQGGEGH